MEKKRKNAIKNIIKEHIMNNSKEYTIALLIFIIGIFIGVFFVNNIQDNQRTEISTYLDNFINKLKNAEEIDSYGLVKTSIRQNILLTVIIWFFGTTVIGIPVVFGIVLYRGFCLGYTISVCISMMGISKGLVFVLISLLLQNIIFIPAILALAVSGFKLYKSIMKDKRRENIKIEIVRHTIFSLVMMIFLIISSLVEIFISTNILKSISKYF